MSTNVNDVEDIVMVCMPSTCDVKAYDFEPLATDTVHESSSEASDSDRSDEDEMTAVAVTCTSGVSSIPVRYDRRRRRIISVY